MGLPLDKKTILRDYFICCVSREISLSIRKEVLNGRAKFGVSDDGKELFQVAMAKAFKPGDFRADYYRGHTLLLALGIASIESLFAQLYADCENDPFSGGRQMNNHHATPMVTADGEWLPHKEMYNLSSDISTTGGQMARGLGLAFASKRYREDAQLGETLFSENGNEVCFCNIGDASTSEGVFWETVNAMGVLQVPLAITVQDDGYGISVPKSYQTTKQSISLALEGFRLNEKGEGIDIYHINGWDYSSLCKTYVTGIEKIRQTHIPAVFHVDELTQPQGHSTSGSHERYKSAERLQWEADYDCNRQFRLWILDQNIATEEELRQAEADAKSEVRAARERAWAAFETPLNTDLKELEDIYNRLPDHTKVNGGKLVQIYEELKTARNPVYSEILRTARHMSHLIRGLEHEVAGDLHNFVQQRLDKGKDRYGRHLYSESPYSALRVPVVHPVYSENSPVKNGFEIINAFFDAALAQYANLYAFGEDVGKIGGVNQGFAGLQTKYGEARVFDTGIREWTIIGQAIGMAMRGLRPIAEIQYLDYLIYAFSALSDDLATLRYRSNSIQAAPAIIRTRGHRFEGIWHSGSPMGVLLGGLRGIYVLTPRNFVQAAGLYNTMLQSDDPALMIECLNAFRLKERLPDNIGKYTVPLGIPEVLVEGSDLTIVTYGACVRIAQTACERLSETGISAELIDVQTLLPFDIEGRIGQSLAKTNRIIFLDEDVPGGCTAFMMREVLEKQGGYYHLDSAPVTLSGRAHRPAYSSDGDYFSKPNVEDVYEAALRMMQEAAPNRF
ncbi:MAG: transketolase [Saprospiraceae bacterium]|nr:transketolase [Saprospiraceae bacterium]